MSEPVAVVVAIPAHDEEASIGACLRSVLEAVEHGRKADAVGEARIAVVAHACTDRTEEEARRALAGAAAEAVVVADDASHTIADVRRGAVAAAMSIGRLKGERTWVLSTDADSLVPRDWITGMLAAARKEAAPGTDDAARTDGRPGMGEAAGVAGMVEVWDWDAPPAAREEYARIVAAGIHGDTHDHVYGANLAVRLDAYLAVGGFARLAHGEDHHLVRKLREAGYGVATPLAPVVRTSGREEARCPDGLGALLRRLAHGGWAAG